MTELSDSMDSSVVVLLPDETVAAVPDQCAADTLNDSLDELCESQAATMYPPSAQLNTFELAVTCKKAEANIPGEVLSSSHPQQSPPAHITNATDSPPFDTEQNSSSQNTNAQQLSTAVKFVPSFGKRKGLSLKSRSKVDEQSTTIPKLQEAPQHSPIEPHIADSADDSGDTLAASLEQPAVVDESTQPGHYGVTASSTNVTDQTNEKQKHSDGKTIKKGQKENNSVAREEKKRMLALKKQEREQKKAEKEIQKMEKLLEKEKKQAERENKKAEQLKKKMEREQKKLEREQKKIEKEQKKKDQPSKIKKKFTNEKVQLSSMDDDDKSSTSVRTTADTISLNEVEPVGGETTPPDHSKTETSEVTETCSKRMDGSEATSSNESNASSSNSPGMVSPQLHVELFKEGDTDAHTSVPERTGEETDDPIKLITTKEEEEVTTIRSIDEDRKQENTREDDEETVDDTSTEHEENQKHQISLLSTKANTNDPIQPKPMKEQKLGQSKRHFRPPLQSETNAPKPSSAKNQATRKRLRACEDKKDKKPKQKIARQRGEQSDQRKNRTTPANTVGPVWVQCDHPDCLKWRMLRDVTDPSLVPDKWFCSMNTDPNYNRCSVREEAWSDPEDDREFIYSQYVPGSIVWAKLEGFPWWPAMVEEDPDYKTYYETDDDNNSHIPVRCHVVFLDTPASRAWIHTLNLHPFTEDCEVPQKHTEPLMSAFQDAQKAIKMSTKERLACYGFLSRYKRHHSSTRSKRSRSPELLGSSKTRKVSIPSDDMNSSAASVNDEDLDIDTVQQ